MDNNPAQGKEILTLIDKNWGQISRSLGLANSRNGQNRATIENRISQALQSLTEDQHTRYPRQRLVAAITDVVGKNWENDVANCIREVCKSETDRLKVHSLHSGTTRDYGTVEHVLTQKTTTEPEIEIETAPKYFRAPINKKALLGIGCSVTLLLLVFVGSIVAMSVLGVTKPSQSKETRVMEGDTVILGEITSSYYKKVELREILKYEDSDHTINSFLLECDRLRKRFTTVDFQSRTLYLYSSTYLLGEQPGNTPIYLLAGSSVSYRFLISTNHSLSAQPEFFIFNNYNDYREFIFGKMEGVKKAIYRQELSVGSPQNPKLTEIIFTPPKDGYYFITGYSEAGVSYQFNATDYVQYLNVSDYIGKYPTCRFNSELSCSFTTDTAFLGTDAKYCLIADIERPFSEDSPSTHIEVHTKKRYDILVISGVVAVVSGIVLVTVSFVVIVASIAKRRSRSRSGYTSIQ